MHVSHSFVETTSLNSEYCRGEIRKVVPVQHRDFDPLDLSVAKASLSN